MTVWRDAWPALLMLAGLALLLALVWAARRDRDPDPDPGDYSPLPPQYEPEIRPHVGKKVTV